MKKTIRIRIKLTQELFLRSSIQGILGKLLPEMIRMRIYKK